jgi:hypothetical protein
MNQLIFYAKAFESEPRAVASVAQSVSLLIEPRSLPLAVLIGRFTLFLARP